MSYRILKVSELSGIPATYSLSGTDLLQVTTGTESGVLSSVKMQLSEYGSFFNTTANTSVIWVSSGNHIYANNAGSVGINDSSPDHTLTVGGSASFTGSITAMSNAGLNHLGGKLGVGSLYDQKTVFEVISTGGPTQGVDIRVVDLHPGGSQSIGFDSTADSTNRSFYIEHSNTNGTLSGDVKIFNEKAIRFHDGGSSSLTMILTGGNVGIGTTSPTYDLEVDGGSAQTHLRISTTGTDANEACLILSNSSKSAYNDGIVIGHGAGKTFFDDLAGETQMSIDMTNSRVGIGTTAPHNLLHIAASDSGAAQVQFTNSTTTHDAPNGLLVGISSTEQGRIWQYEDNDILFGTNNADSMIIKSSGNVGIGEGSINPTISLVVSGTDAMCLPKGNNSSERPGTPYAGMLRYNVTDNIFEGYANGAWGSLGGVKDTDGDTYILAETSAGNDDDILHFYQAGTKRLEMTSSGWTPHTTLEMDLGTTSKYWRQAYINNVIASNNGTFGGSLTVNGSSTLGNSTDDIATCSGPLRLSNGSLAAPALAFENDTNTGIYTASNNSNAFHLVCNAESQLFIQDGSILPQGVIADSKSNVNLGSSAAYWDHGYINDLHVLSTGVVTNLNADQVDGADRSSFVQAGSYHSGAEMLTLSGYNGSAYNAITRISIPSGNPFDQNLNVADSPQFASLGVGMAASTTTGRIDATNDVVFYSSSDIKLKENIVPIHSSLDKLSQINGVEFDWKDDYINSIGGVNNYTVRKNDVGIIAQEIEEVLPQAVATRGDGIKAVRYEKLVPLLIEAIKELNEKVERLEGGN